MCACAAARCSTHQGSLPVCALTVWLFRGALLDLQGRTVWQLQAARRWAESCDECAEHGSRPVMADIGANVRKYKLTHCSELQLQRPVAAVGFWSAG